MKLFKNSFVKIALMAVVILIAVMSFKTYQNVNAQGYRDIKEVPIRIGQQIDAPNVKFKVIHQTQARSDNGSTIDLLLEIQQTGPANYGMRKGNYQFNENMTVASEYSAINFSRHIFDEFGKEMNLKNFEAGKMIKCKVHFDEVRNLDKTTHFAFLVKNGKTFTKYVLPIQ